MAGMRQRKRNKSNRNRKSVVIIGCEGNNKTEKLYFRNYISSGCVIKFASGNSTDPKGIVQDLIRYIKNEIELEEEDKIYAIFDTDINQNKKRQIEEATRMAKDNGIEIITSTPAFEVWFLLHFLFTTKAFKSNDDLLINLKKYINSYSKSSNTFVLIKEFTNLAIENAKRLEKFHLSSEENLNSGNCNPYTAVYKVVEELIERNTKEQR